MAPTIHINDALWHRLGQQARPFEDPQQVMERLITQTERSEGESLQLDYQTLTEIKDLVEHDDHLSTVIDRYIRIHPGQTGKPQDNDPEEPEDPDDAREAHEPHPLGTPAPQHSHGEGEHPTDEEHSPAPQNRVPAPAQATTGGDSSVPVPQQDEPQVAAGILRGTSLGIKQSLLTILRDSPSPRTTAQLTYALLTDGIIQPVPNSPHVPRPDGDEEGCEPHPHVEACLRQLLQDGLIKAPTKTTWAHIPTAASLSTQPASTGPETPEQPPDHRRAILSLLLGAETPLTQGQILSSMDSEKLSPDSDGAAPPPITSQQANQALQEMEREGHLVNDAKDNSWTPSAKGSKWHVQATLSDVKGEPARSQETVRINRIIPGAMRTLASEYRPWTTQEVADRLSSHPGAARNRKVSHLQDVQYALEVSHRNGHCRPTSDRTEPDLQTDTWLITSTGYRMWTRPAGPNAHTAEQVSPAWEYTPEGSYTQAITEILAQPDLPGLHNEHLERQVYDQLRPDMKPLDIETKSIHTPPLWQESYQNAKHQLLRDKTAVQHPTTKLITLTQKGIRELAQQSMEQPAPIA